MRIYSNNMEMGCGVGSFWRHKDKCCFKVVVALAGLAHG